jgi:hypothetical protein
MKILAFLKISDFDRWVNDLWASGKGLRQLITLSKNDDVFELTCDDILINQI